MASHGKKIEINIFFSWGCCWPECPFIYFFFFCMISVTENKLCTVVPLRRKVAPWREKWRGTNRVPGHPLQHPPAQLSIQVPLFWCDGQRQKQKPNCKVTVFSWVLSHKAKFMPWTNTGANPPMKLRFCQAHLRFSSNYNRFFKFIYYWISF